jgi:hypothetical protein
MNGLGSSNQLPHGAGRGPLLSCLRLRVGGDHLQSAKRVQDEGCGNRLWHGALLFGAGMTLHSAPQSRGADRHGLQLIAALAA